MLVHFCYLSLYLGIETVYCRLLQRMARMGQPFQVLNNMPAKITETLIMV